MINQFETSHTRVLEGLTYKQIGERLKFSAADNDQIRAAGGAEFAIRPFIRAHPEVTMSRMLAWAEDRDWRLRRLASEGSRPRLPWAKQLQAFIKDPSPTIEILDLLYDDTNLVVRRSAANHLNARGAQVFSARLAREVSAALAGTSTRSPGRN